MASSRPGKVVRAVIVGPYSEHGMAQAIGINDPDKLRQLEAFFPNYKSRPSSEVAGGWIVKYEVYFHFHGNEVLHVTVSANENGRYWSAGRGDFTQKRCALCRERPATST